jgi:glycosyltransferase involved in cell wall biosynthesis
VGGSPSAPRISVVVPTYDRVAMVPEAIDSVLAQDPEDVEVVVVDDGSRDGTDRVLARRYAGDPRVRVHRQENSGVAQARNRGIDLATGSLIGFLDSDDLYLPGFLSAHAAALAAHPEAAMSLCDARYDDVASPAGPTMLRRMPDGPPTSIEDVCRGGWAMITPALFRADVVRSLGFSSLYFAEDTEFLCRFLLAGHRFVVDPRALYAYRHHAGVGSEPQRTDHVRRRRIDGVRLRAAYLDRCRFTRAQRLTLRRRWAKELYAEGFYAEARSHLWAWWAGRPLQWRAPWMLLRSLRRSEPEPARV